MPTRTWSRSCLDGDGRFDERQVDERLRKVAEERAAPGIDFLRVEANAVRAGDEAIHERGGFVDAAGARQRRHEPERAVQKTALAARETVVRVVAIDEISRAEQSIDGVDRGGQARRVWKANGRQHQQARVDIVSAGDPGVAAERIGPALALDEVDEGGRLAAPAVDVARRQLAALGQSHGAIERRPAHRLRVRELERTVADLPDSRIRTAPDVA